MVGLFVDIARQYETLLSYYNRTVNKENSVIQVPTARINYERYLKLMAFVLKMKQHTSLPLLSTLGMNQSTSKLE
jgi:hypothetical protein